jgi:hypothetical protein
MADENKIEFEIVLNDGSTQKVFLKLEKQAEKSAKNIQDDLSQNAGQAFDKIPTNAQEAFGQVSKIIGSTFGRIAIVATAAFAYVKKKFDETLEGEKLLRVEKQFQSLATQAGVSAAKIQDDFTRALGGVVDDSKAFEILNQSLAKTSVTASKLPELMTLARKATNLFGGDAIQNFNDITSAVANGNARQLRNLGIIVDAEKAQREYAKSIGTSVDYLTLEGKQQAILNEVLKIGESRFKGVDVSVGGATEASQRLGVALNNLFDDLAKKTASSLGPTFAKLLNGSATLIETTKDAFLGASKTASQLSDEVGRLESKLKGLQAQAATFGTAIPVGLKGQIADVSNQLDISRIAFDDARKATLSFGAAQEKTQQKLVDELRLMEARKKFLLEYGSQVRGIALQNIQTAISEADGIADAEERKKQIKFLKLSEIQLQEQTALDQFAVAQEQNRKAGIIKEDEYQALRTAIMEEYANKRKLIEDGEAIARETRMRESADTIKGIINTGLISTVSAGMQRLGASLAKGPAAFDDFGKAILGIIGDMLVNMGQAMVVASTAWQTFIAAIKSFFPASGLVAGLALMAGF